MEAIGDECVGCQEFKATMLEITTGDQIRFKRDEEGRLLTPPSLAEAPPAPSSEQIASLLRSIQEEQE